MECYDFYLEKIAFQIIDNLYVGVGTVFAICDGLYMIASVNSHYTRNGVLRGPSRKKLDLCNQMFIFMMVIMGEFDVRIRNMFNHKLPRCFSIIIFSVG